MSEIEHEIQDGKVVPIRGMRGVIARKMMESLQSGAQLTIDMSADITELMQQRKKRNEQKQENITLTDILVKAVAGVLTEYKHVNGWAEEKQIRLKNSVDMGVAVAISGGLIVPVIRDAANKDLSTISSEIKELGKKAQSMTLKPDECMGSTFTITNLGMYGVSHFTPIINSPEIAILGAGAAKQEPVLKDNAWVPRMMLPLSLTFNHCVLDGAPAAEFLQKVCKMLSSMDVMSA